MAHLSLSLLGPFQAALDGQPVTGFESGKVRALLAYLAVEADRPHPRAVLAGLLWPDWPDQAALSNLRYALSNLRQAIGDRQASADEGDEYIPDIRLPFLLVTRDAIQFNTASDYTLDLTGLEDLSSLAVERLVQAVALYRGRFLEGFSCDSAPFEEWALFKREQIERQVLDALHRLAVYCEQRGEYEQAQSYARRQLELEPWDERAHQQLMRALALSGRRSAALVQYETCRRLLEQELGVEPAQETTALVESIRAGTLDRATRGPGDRERAPAVIPPFLQEREQVGEKPTPVFVAQERELARLAHFLDLALAGQGRVVFVTGDPGSGKTALVQEFVRRAMEMYGDLVVAQGNGNAHTGFGDPYLPFVEALQMLAGDVEARWAGGSIVREHARRLWNLLPTAAQALVDLGPDLLDRFVPGTALVARARVAAPGGAAWLARLDELVGHKAALPPGQANLPQVDLFEQYTRIVRAVALEHPALLVLDDLQWADAGSVGLLFHLGRHLAGSRALIVGAYRPADLALGRSGERHPLEPVVNEFRREWGDVCIDLAQADGRPFVEAFLDTEPNRLGTPFRDMLYQHTGGHPLFTVELLRGLQERGDLLQDESGHWIEGPALNWERLPARVEAVIAERIGRLPDEWQAMLAAASVEGEEFTAEALAHVQRADAREIVRRLSGDLTRRHRLVSAATCQRVGDLRLSRYRFRHYLFQRYLYDSLDQVERAHLHEEMGTALEMLYGEQAGEIAASLAWHFSAAGMAVKAAQYVLQMGDKALRLSAYQEAVTHCRRGLALLEASPDAPARAGAAPGPSVTLGVPLRLGLGVAHLHLGEYPAAREHLAAALEAARRSDDQAHVARALYLLGHVASAEGDYAQARAYLEEGLPLARASADAWILAQVLYGLGDLDWRMGDYDRARACCEESLALARQVGDTIQELYTLNRLGALVWDTQGDLDQAQRLYKQVHTRASQIGSRGHVASALANLGAVASERGDIVAAQAYYQQAHSIMREIGLQQPLAMSLIGLADGYMRLGDWAAAWQHLREALALARRIGATPMVLAVVANAGELLVRQGDAERGLALLGLALRHPASFSDLEADVSGRLAKLGLDAANPAVVAGLEAGQALDLDAVVAELAT